RRGCGLRAAAAGPGGHRARRCGRGGRPGRGNACRAEGCRGRGGAVTTWGEVEYTRLRELRGPLAIVEQVSGVGWDEFVRITLGSGEVRYGLVLEADREVAVVQVLE